MFNTTNLILANYKIYSEVQHQGVSYKANLHLNKYIYI